MIRVISFVVIGVVLSAPLLSRIAQFRVDWTVARRLLLWACAGLVVDVAAEDAAGAGVAALLLRSVGW